MESVNSGMVRGAGWSLLLRAIDRGVGLVSTVVLARLLVPADFGVVALAASLIDLAGLLGAFGLELSLIQNPAADRRHFDTVWTCNALFGLGLAAVLVLLAPLAAHYCSEPRLAPVIIGLAGARAIAGFQNVGLVLFQRDLAFDRDFKFRLYKRLATTFVATLPLAFVLRSQWALVGGAIAGSCIGLVLSYGMQPYRPRWSLVAWRELFAVSRWLQFAQLLRVVSERGSHFIIARFAGLSALGSFAMAKEIAQLPSGELTTAVHAGVFPGYAKIFQDRALLKQTYLRVTAILFLVTMPAGVALALLAQPVVAVTLGNHWLAVVPLLQILALNYVLSVFSRSTGYVYIALGDTRRNASQAALHAAVSLSIMLLLVPALGVVGAALALLAGTLAVAPVNFRMLGQALGVTLPELLAIAWRPLLATMVMALILVWLGGQAASPQGLGANALHLAWAAAVGLVAYVGALALLWRMASRPDGAESLVLARMKILASAAAARLKSWFTG